MRCPKCGFISFDLVEQCAKCGKNIGVAAKALQGTTANMKAPVFLRLGQEAEPGAGAAEAGLGAADVAEAETVDLGGEGEEPMLDFSTEETSSTESESLSMDIGGEAVSGEAQAETGPETFELEAAEETAEPSMDISDLAPTEEQGEVEETMGDAGTEEFALAEEEAAGEMESAHELEDLKVEGLDLESAPQPAEGKVMPSVKTGTALDDFNVDLGDLLPKKE
jgi:hypothetical protein